MYTVKNVVKIVFMNTVCNTVYSKECSEVCSGKIRSEERVEVCGKVHLTQDDKLLLYDGGEIVKNIDDFRVERRTCACVCVNKNYKHI